MEFVDQMIGNYGYVAVFTLLALGLFSMPIPDELMVILVGYYTKLGILQYTVSIMVVFIGTFSGMLVSYGVGKRADRPLMNCFFRRSKLTSKWVIYVEKWFNQYGSLAVIMCYFFPGIRHISGIFFWSIAIVIKKV